METREAISKEWLDGFWTAWPALGASFLARDEDPFQNPVGTTIRQAMAILLDELLRGMNRDRVTAALDSIMQIRAVEGCAPSRAVEFLFRLKPILGRHAPGAALELVFSEIDEAALIAFDLYIKHRERAFEARANEARRRVFVLARRFGDGGPDAWEERTDR